MKYISQAKRKAEYKTMYEAYLKYEKLYLQWEIERNKFNSALENHKYYSRYSHKRREFAESLRADFPILALSAKDIHHQVGGIFEIVVERDKDLYNFVYDTSPFFYLYLKDNPKYLFDAIENTYDLSIKLGIKTSFLVQSVPNVLEFIANRCVLCKENNYE